MNKGIYISAINYYLPGHVEYNIDLQNEFPERVNADLIEKTGVKSKHISKENFKTSHLALIAGEQLLRETTIDKNSIDALVYCSVDQDYVTPPTSCLLQNQLGLSTKVATFDLTHACSGYIYSLVLAKGLINGLDIKNVLVLTASMPSKYTHPHNFSTRLLFGDAGSATLVSQSDFGTKGDIGEFVLGTDGAGFQKIIVRDGRDANPFSANSTLEKTDQFGNVYTDINIYMDGPGTFLFVIKKVPGLIEETLQKNGLHKNDIDLYILHQANYYALEQVRNKLKIEPERFFYNMQDIGNVIQSSIPIAIKQAIEKGKIKPGNKVLIAGFGTGMSWGATVLTF